MSDARPHVLFVHGLWLHATAWQPWVDLFREAGYDASAPGWPGERDTVAETRAHAGRPRRARHRRRRAALRPADRAGGPARPRRRPTAGCRSSSGTPSAARSWRSCWARASPPPRSPSTRRRSRACRPALLLVAQRLPGAPQPGQPGAGRLPHLRAVPVRLRQRDPEPRSRTSCTSGGRSPRPVSRCSRRRARTSVRHSEAEVDTDRSDRGPLLLIAGGQDHTAPEAVTRGTLEQYRHSTAVTELQELDDRGHSLTIDHGWREVAELVLDWLRRPGPGGAAAVGAGVPLMDLGLAGKIAVVTGASKGIGLAITRALVAEGVVVVAGSRTAGPDLPALAEAGQRARRARST